MVSLDLNIALVGAGRMGRWHAAAARRAGARVAAVVDSDEAAAARLARPLGAEPFATLDEALATRAIAAVHVCTPVESHPALASLALEAGTPVLVEKPLAATAPEVEALVETARRRGTYVCPAHQYAFQAGVERALARIPSAGPLRRIDFNICSAGAVGPFAGRPDAVVAEILPHPISIVQRFLPEAGLDRLPWDVRRPAAGELAACAVAGQAVVSLYVSLNARPPCFEVALQTDGGRFDLDGFHGFGVFSRPEVSRLAKLAGPFRRAGAGLWGASANLAGRARRAETAYPGLQALVARFYAHLRGEASAPIALDAMIEGARARDTLLAQAMPVERAARGAHG